MDADSAKASSGPSISLSSLMIDLIDGESGRPVWRAEASEVMGNPSLKKVQKKIDKVTRKMFKDFPPR